MRTAKSLFSNVAAVVIYALMTAVVIVVLAVIMIPSLDMPFGRIMESIRADNGHDDDPLADGTAKTISVLEDIAKKLKCRARPRDCVVEDGFEGGF